MSDQVAVEALHISKDSRAGKIAIGSLVRLEPDISLPWMPRQAMLGLVIKVWEGAFCTDGVCTVLWPDGRIYIHGQYMLTIEQEMS